MRKVIAELFSPPRPSDTDYYHGVDLLRGLAAMAVVLFHYLNFFIPAGATDAVANFHDLEPLHQMLWPFYQYGLFAVQLFWLISGFVFAAVYAGRTTKPGKFFINRFARLYPLHFVTLLVVAGLQIGRFHALGNFQTYQFNDLYHFVLNLFFASSWGLELGMSFNGPIWSVSVEVAIYGAFLVTLPFLYRRGILGPLALAVLFTSGSAFKLPGTVFWQCGFYFFLGSAIHIAFGVLRDRPWIFAFAGAGALIAAAAACLKPHGIGIAHLMPIVLPGLFLLACAF
jgi:peptidoglycan/LPS O-acetylase OafA/YrhL